MNITDKESEAYSSTALILQVFEERTAESVQNDEEMDYEAQNAMISTQRISRIALIVSSLLSIAVFYLIGTLVLSMGKITERMQVMTENVAFMDEDFNEVSNLMRKLDSSVIHMSSNISGIPVLGTHVTLIDENFVQMVGAMNGIRPGVGEIDQLLSVMERDMKQMNSVFDQLNYTVGFMARDVNTLSAPIRMMPPFFGN